MSLFNPDLLVRSENLSNSFFSITNSIDGIKKTDGISPIGLIGRGGKKESPGFTPNQSYVNSVISLNNDWYGNLLDIHPDNSRSNSFKHLSTVDRFDMSKSFPNFKDDVPDPSRFYTTRDNYLLFNDSSTDYFRHGLHVIENKTPLTSDKNTRETFDGHESGTPLRLSNLLEGITEGTSFENNDPVLYGFEIVIDDVSSPLLNTSVENFITQFSNISEIASRRLVITEFKQQFYKIFKTITNTPKDIQFPDNNPDGSKFRSITIGNADYSNTEKNTNVFNSGKRAYFSYYLKKISGLELLIESNSPNKKKYLVDYRNDMLKLSFTEDVSATIGTLSHLYKLLYWSKSNGKSLIPDNLLRFNCDIIISEVRNLNRVRRAIDTKSLEVIKDNVSRYVYSLKECQFYFDQPPHDNEIDLSQETKPFDNFSISMDFKFVTSKFERWTPDGEGFGQYVGYDNGTLWKTGSKYRPTPLFYTSNSNYLRQNGVQSSIALENYNYTYTNVISDMNDKTDLNNNIRTEKSKNQFDVFKEASKKAAKSLASDFNKAVEKEVSTQVNTRLRLLNNTIDNIRKNSVIGRMREPSNIYKAPYVYNSQVSNNFFYDVHNSLRDFAGDSIGSVLGGKIGGIIKGGR